MKKPKVTAISNREDYFCITTEKDSNHYPFLFSLLKHFGEKIPDIQDYMGRDPDITKEEDSYSFYGEKNISIIHVIGKDKVFLFMKTDRREELSQFILDNANIAKVDKK